MLHKETVDAYMEVYNKDFFVSNNKDVFCYPDIENNVKAAFRRNFGVSLDEEILFARDTSFWNNRNQGVVITDAQIIFIEDNDDEDSRFAISWGDIESVRHKEGDLYFHLCYSNEPVSFDFHNYFEKGIDVYYATDIMENDDEEDEDVVELSGNVFAKLLTKLAKTHEGEDIGSVIDNIWEEAIGLMDDEKDEEALQLLLKSRKELEAACFTPTIASLYLKMGHGEKGIRLLNEDIKRLEHEKSDADILIPYYYKKCQIHKDMGEFAEARKACAYIMSHVTKDTEIEGEPAWEKANEDMVDLDNEFVRHFLEMPHKNRRLLVPVNSFTDLSQKKMVVLDINNLPAIHFPMGHPIANQLYVGHPYTPAMYIPFENYELVLLEDKLREYCQVMQFLGATEINIESVSSTDKNSDVSRNRKMSGDVNVKTFSASGKYENNTTNKLLEAISHSLQLHQKYSPHGKPMLPEKLVWYAHEPSWQRTFEQRIQGSLLEHEERIETRKNRVVDNSELTEISAELKNLVASAHGHWTQSMASKFETRENVVLSIRVKFAPLESLQGNAPATGPAQITQQGNLTETEKDYLEEVKSCLEEDGEITARARRLLNRIREKSGITEERAAELEATLRTPQLTEEEKEYLDEYKACLEESEDGILSPRERRLLNKIRVSLDITEERAAELERM